MGHDPSPSDSSCNRPASPVRQIRNYYDFDRSASPRPITPLQRPHSPERPVSPSRRPVSPFRQRLPSDIRIHEQVRENTLCCLM